MHSKNNIARFGWGFSLFFLSGCAAFTWIFIRDGFSHIPVYAPDIPDQYPPWVIAGLLTLFWAAGLGLANHFLAIPCVAVEIKGDNSIRVERRWLFRRISQFLLPHDIASAEIIEIKDSEGDPYFMTRITTQEGWSVDIAESSDRATCTQVLDGFNAAANMVS
ncbi:MAG: hypothetical protein QM776_15490 [Rhodocyclaceae bacterium]